MDFLNAVFRHLSNTISRLALVMRILSEIENNRICQIPFPQTNYFLEDIENIMSSALFTRTEKAVIYSQYKDRYDEYLYTKQHSNLYKEAF